ncbi:DNA replication/repair protein RecF [Boudabousia tangfeifanii]|uniref:DNA replication/repair protein RecF n=1 Tax=Boudabousia tangfeifanii TaxID=1912795 RepID=UPI001EEE6CFC|nr:DNA replication/repair protein RecF [Boudabousia tangfeifanii]
MALDDFRSYRQIVATLVPGVNVLSGPNGQGKTNFVEAISYLANLSSHRVGAESALVRANPDGTKANAAVIRLKVCQGERERILELEIVSSKPNRARINRTAVRPRELAYELKTVIFAPEDLQLVRAEPALRRKFLDEGVAAWRPTLSQLKTDYEKVLRQRGALLKDLKSGRADSYAQSTLEVWNGQLATLGAQLTIARENLVAQLLAPTQKAHNKIASQGREIFLAYQRQVDKTIAPEKEIEETRDLAQRLQAAMAQREREEIARGVNLIGPHRDDLEIKLDHLPVRGFASHGESWSVALALKLGLYEVLGGQSEDRSERPVLILDDVFAELDSYRRAALAEIISGAEQVLITTAEASELPESLDAHHISVRRDPQAGSIFLETETLPVDGPVEETKTEATGEQGSAS